MSSTADNNNNNNNQKDERGASETPPAYAIKDASHAAFYAGVFKGMRSAARGILLFVRTPSLQALLLTSLRPLYHVHLLYAAALLLILFVSPSFHHGPYALLLSLARWGRLITCVLSLFLDLRSKRTHPIFYASLAQSNPALADSLRHLPKPRQPLRLRWLRFKRLAKLALFKLSALLVKHLVPSGRRLAIPVLEFVSTRSVLGDPLAAAVSLLYALPSDLLLTTELDDLLSSFAEAIIDADELGADLAKPYLSRLDSPTNDYVLGRYRGYLVGCGFVFSMLSPIPFLGIPLALVAEAGSACMVSDILRRNLSKPNRLPLPAEQLVQPQQQRPKQS